MKLIIIASLFLSIGCILLPGVHPATSGVYTNNVVEDDEAHFQQSRAASIAEAAGANKSFSSSYNKFNDSNLRRMSPLEGLSGKAASTFATKPAVTILHQKQQQRSRKRELSTSDTLQTCLAELAVSNCPDDKSPISALLFDGTATTSTSSTSTISALTIQSTKEDMNDVYDTLASNIVTLEEFGVGVAGGGGRRRSNSKSIGATKVLSALDALLPRITLGLDLLRLYLAMSVSSDTLTCDIGTSGSGTTRIATVQSLQTSTADLMDGMMSLVSSNKMPGDHVTFEEVLYYILLVVNLVVDIINAIVGSFIQSLVDLVLFPFRLVLNIVVGIFEYLRYLLDRIIDFIFGDPFPGLRLTNLGNDSIEQQVNQCKDTFTTITAPSTPLSRGTMINTKDRFFTKFWSEVLESEPLQSLLEQQSVVKNTSSYDLFVCEYKLSLCD